VSGALPANWESWPLSDVGDWLGGGTPSSTNPDFWDGEIPWVSPKDMKVNCISSTQDHITSEAVRSSATKLISPPAVLFVTRSGILAHSFPVATTNIEVTVNQDIKAILPVEVVSSLYLAWALRSLERRVLSTCSKHGTTVHSIEISALRALRVPIPPLAEQHRIVAKIEELFSELDKGVESLTTAREQLKVYRQAVLKNAFEGKLTADWRSVQTAPHESLNQLRTRLILAQQKHHQDLTERWQGAIEHWKQSGSLGVKPRRVRPLESISQISSEISTALPDLAPGWAWEKLGWMTCGVEYGTSAKSSEVGAVPVIRMGNLQDGRIDWSDLVFTSDVDEISQYQLAIGDVLFNRTNSPEWVGKTAIYRGERPAIFAGYLIRINHNEAVLDGNYLNYFLNSPLARQYGDTVKTDGVNQSNINGEKLQGYPFPYCSLAEQKEIVRILDEALSSTDHAISEIDSQLSRAIALRQSILHRAFSGQLVPQDPNDEPASVLIDRIKAEKDVTGTNTRKPRKLKAQGAAV
jgi:type I restriction enzyme S subunit